MGTNEKYVDNLFSKIKVLERKFFSKNKEIKDLERYLVLPGERYQKTKHSSFISLLFTQYGHYMNFSENLS